MLSLIITWADEADEADEQGPVEDEDRLFATDQREGNRTEQAGRRHGRLSFFPLGQRSKNGRLQTDPRRRRRLKHRPDEAQESAESEDCELDRGMTRRRRRRKRDRFLSWQKQLGNVRAWQRLVVAGGRAGAMSPLPAPGIPQRWHAWEWPGRFRPLIE